jgi:hypothetical protein
MVQEKRTVSSCHSLFFLRSLEFPNFKRQITLEDLNKIDIRVRIDPHKRTCNQQPSHLPNGRQPGNWAVTAEDSLRKSASEARLKRRGRLTDSQPFIFKSSHPENIGESGDTTSKPLMKDTADTCSMSLNLAFRSIR